MNRNRKRRTELGITVLTASLLFSACAVQGVAKDKSETVYVIADASGNAKDVIVEEWLRNTDSQILINDKSDLTGIENTNGEETFTQDGNNIIWDAKGNDIHYQGTSKKEIPVSVKITYYLDGKEISPEELAGKSGKVKIRYDYTNLEKKEVKIAGKKEAVYVPFTVMSGMVFTNNCVKDVSINSGKVIENDDTTVVVGVAFPGLKESLEKDEESELDIELDIPDYVEVTFEAENFEMEMSTSIVMSDLFHDLDLDNDEGRQELKDAMEELTDGAQKLVDGSSELADGVGELYDKLPDLTDGIQSLKDGIAEYTDGVASVNSGIGELKSGSSELVNGFSRLSSGAGGLADGADSLADGAKALASGTDEMQAGVSEVKSGTEQLLEGYSGENGAMAGAKSLEEGAKQLDSGMDELVAGADTLISGADTLASGLTSVHEGAVALDKGADSLQDGVKSLQQGTGQLTSSSEQLVTGIENVSVALQELQMQLEGDETENNPGQIKQLQAALAQVSQAIGSADEGETSIHNCRESILKDVNILYNFYCNPEPIVEEQALSAAAYNETDAESISERMESAASAKAAANEAAVLAAEKGKQALSSISNANGKMTEAENSRTLAAEEAGTADALYQNALNAYTPILANIKNTLDTVGLSQYAVYVDDGQGTASAVAGSYQAAQGSYESVAGSFVSAASEYEVAAAGYQEATENYEAALTAYEQTIAEYEAVIAQYEEMLAGETMVFEAAETQEQPAEGNEDCLAVRCR